MNPRMLVEFVDGSKTMVEMAAIANATGLVPDMPGMHGPAASLDELHKVLCPTADGGVLSRKGVVDYSIGKGVAPGVFVVAEMAHPRIRERMDDLKMGTGPYYTFFRPYHLTQPRSAADLRARRALRQGRHGAARHARRPRSARVAKRDLKPGDSARCHRRVLLPRLDHDGDRGARRKARCPAACSSAAWSPQPIAQGRAAHLCQRRRRRQARGSSRCAARQDDDARQARRAGA